MQNILSTNHNSVTKFLAVYSASGLTLHVH